MEKERERKEAGPRDAAAWKTFSSFTRCSRRVFLCVNGLSDDFQGRRYVPTNATVLTASTFHLFQSERISFAF